MSVDNDVKKVIESVEDVVTTPTRTTKIRVGLNVGRLIVDLIKSIGARVRARRQSRKSKEGDSL